MKKKFIVPSKDKKDWMLFTKQIGNISPKEVDITSKTTINNKARKLDLHGFSLIGANKAVKKFVIDSSNSGYKKLLIIKA